MRATAIASQASFGSPLVGKRELHLGWDYSDEGIQRPSILVVVDVAVPDYLPHVPHLELYPHHRSPLDVVGLGEGRPPTVGADVPDNSLETMVTMVPIRGERATLPVKVTLSIDPSATIAVRASSRSAGGASASVWAAAALVGMCGCPLRRPCSRCLPP